MPFGFFTSSSSAPASGNVPRGAKDNSSSGVAQSSTGPVVRVLPSISPSKQADSIEYRSASSNTSGGGSNAPSDTCATLIAAAPPGSASAALQTRTNSSSQKSSGSGVNMSASPLAPKLRYGTKGVNDAGEYEIPPTPFMISRADDATPSKASCGQRVTFAGITDVREVEADQENPIIVPAMYSPVRYVSRKEQRLLQMYTEMGYPPPALPPTDGDVLGLHFANSMGKLFADRLPAGPGTGRRFPIILEGLARGFPIDLRPLLPSALEPALDLLQKGTYLVKYDAHSHPCERFLAIRNVPSLTELGRKELSLALLLSEDAKEILDSLPLGKLYDATCGCSSLGFRKTLVTAFAVKGPIVDGTRQLLSTRFAFSLRFATEPTRVVDLLAKDHKTFQAWVVVVKYICSLNYGVDSSIGGG